MSKKQKTQMYASGGAVRSSKGSEYYKDTDSRGAVTLTRKGSDADANARSSASRAGSPKSARTVGAEALGIAARSKAKFNPSGKDSAYTEATNARKRRDGK
jgi:hypothetical protein